MALAGAMALLASPGAAPLSLALLWASGDSARMLANLLHRSSTGTRSNWRETPFSAPRREAVLSRPTSRWPVRTWAEPNISEP